MELEFTDRYGGNPPSTLRVCRGFCEGMGFYPDMDNYQTKYGGDINKVEFLKCPDCQGTGRVNWIETILRIPSWIWGVVHFTFAGPSRYGKRTLLDYWLCFKAAFLPDLGLRRFM
jgi:hypothetical protein